MYKVLRKFLSKSNKDTFIIDGVKKLRGTLKTSKEGLQILKDNKKTMEDFDKIDFPNPFETEYCKSYSKTDAQLFIERNASKMEMELSDEGFDVEEVYQSHRSLNEATAGYREQVYEGNVIVIINPVLNFAMANAAIRTNQGLIKIDKDATIQRIDPVDAMLCAFKLAMYHIFDSGQSSDEWLESEDW